MSPKIVLASHHKTGSVFLRKVFEEFAKHVNMSFCFFDKGDKGPKKLDLLRYDIILLRHANIKQIEQIIDLNAKVKVAHAIRNPRAMLISSTLYHKDSTEKWLHVPRPSFQGKTFQEKINTLSIKDALLFQLEHSKNIKDMLELKRYLSKNTSIKSDCFRLEDLSHDKSLLTYQKLLSFLDFEGFDLLKGIEICANNSLWYKKRAHSRTGASEELIPEFDLDVEKKFQKIFSDADKIIAK